MKILVLGGTRYFGKRLVELLLEKGHSVTLGTRGTTPDPFGNRVRRQVTDRTDRKSLLGAAESENWDVVVDQICYSPDEAAIACEVFKGRVRRYVHTSTASVYTTHGSRAETEFDPFRYPIRGGGRSDFDYGEAKRQAEAVYFQKGPFPVVAMRIPIVLGSDDYTGRLEFHIERIVRGKPIVVPNPDAKTSYISSAEAARFLLWLVEGDQTGPINAASDGALSIGEILQLIERRLKKKAIVLKEGPDSDCTPIADSKDLLLDTGRARAEGFHFEPVTSWLPGLVEELCAHSY